MSSCKHRGTNVSSWSYVNKVLIVVFKCEKCGEFFQCPLRPLEKDELIVPKRTLKDLDKVNPVLSKIVRITAKTQQIVDIHKQIQAIIAEEPNGSMGSKISPTPGKELGKNQEVPNVESSSKVQP